MNRESMLSRLSGTWDIAIIGGGATGLGCAVESASRGYRTVLLEQDDFAKATSSRSTKLIHGGLRYLRQGNVSLVFESLRERGRLLRNAPHLVRDLPFIIPVYDWWESPFYGLGLRVYDLLAGELGLRPSRKLSADETLERIPTLETEGLRGGLVYADAQFDDARLAITLARTAADHGAVVLNHAPVSSLLRQDGRVCGVIAHDRESGEELVVEARVVVNATGVFADQVRRMDEPDAAPLIAPSQGVHIVLDRSFHPGDDAIMVPHTSDGRVLFAVPWLDRVIVGTTDTAVPEIVLEPAPRDDEIEFLLSHARQYLTREPWTSDVLSCFAGLRPLIASADEKRTAALSRDHVVLVSPSRLVTTTGGKWTTYRKMAEETIDRAAEAGELELRESVTKRLELHGWIADRDDGIRSSYGTDRYAIERLETEQPELAQPLHPRLPYRASEVVWGVREEMARTVEDVLARRLRALLLDARASIECAPRVAALIAAELRRDEHWIREQIEGYGTLARRYLPDRVAVKD